MCAYPSVLRLDAFVEGRTMRDLSEGRETTIVAVYISAVHHASMYMLGLVYEGFFLGCD